MIHTGRWVYRKYKKHRDEKAELQETAHLKHDRVLSATQAEISKTAIKDLCSPLSGAEEARTSSDIPPSYSKVEEESLTSPTSTIRSSSSDGQDSSASSHSPLQTRLSHSRLSATLRSCSPGPPGPFSPLSPAPGAQQPAEIQVRGKWVWVPEDEPPLNVAAVRPVSDVFPSESAVAELSAPAHFPEELSSTRSLPELPSILLPTKTREEDRNKEFAIAELDGSEVSTANSR
jgi:hypothetical protein